MSTQNLNFNDYDPKIKGLISSLSSSAELSIVKDFPNSIDELNKILKDERFDLSKVNNIFVDTKIPVPFSNSASTNANGTPSSNKRKRTSSETDNSGNQVETLKGGTTVLVLPSGSVPSNHHIRDLIEEIKPKILKLIDDVAKLRMWIIFSIPPIEGGNNFGVSIQEDALAEIKAVESEATTYFEHFSRYYLTRAKAIAKICKFPHIDDFRQVLKEIDERQILELKLSVTEMKNHYSSIYDLVFKNYDKIKKPKSNNSSIMY